MNDAIKSNIFYIHVNKIKCNIVAITIYTHAVRHRIFTQIVCLGQHHFVFCKITIQLSIKPEYYQCPLNHMVVNNDM